MDHSAVEIRRGIVLHPRRAMHASIMLSATGIVASVLVPQTLTDPHPLLFAVLAVVALGAGLLCCIAVIWPVHDSGKYEPHRSGPKFGRGRPRAWKLTLSRSEFERLPWSQGEVGILNAIVEELDPWRIVNYRTIRARTWAFNWACLLLPVQIAFWVAVVWS